jgi:Fe-Mn family superoxide dismutase
MMTRRQALKNTAVATAVYAAVSASRLAIAQPPPAAPPPRPGFPPGPVPPPRRVPAPSAVPAPVAEEFTLPPLPYPVDALEPHIDAMTMEIHHGKHHAAYVTNLNKALAEHPHLRSRPVDHLLKELNTLPENVRTAVRHFGGGHHNHSIFWAMMKHGGSEPRGPLARAIDRTFGGFPGFKQQLTEAATKVFGSGWAWLVWDGQGLKIETTANQDSPLTTGRQPLLGIDVWEHAYYLKYQNRRPEYIDGWFRVINWEYISERYAPYAG